MSELHTTCDQCEHKWASSYCLERAVLMTFWLRWKWLLSRAVCQKTERSRKAISDHLKVRDWPATFECHCSVHVFLVTVLKPAAEEIVNVTI